jgi:hypothetical protein
VQKSKHVVAARLWRGGRGTWQARLGGDVTAWRSCGGWPCREVAVLQSWQRKEWSALSLKFTSASSASLANGSAAVKSLGGQLGVWGAAVGARYNSSLNPDLQHKYAASRHGL